MNKKKVITAIIIVIVGSAVSLLALAAVVAILSRQTYASVFNSSILYVLWGALIVAAVLAFCFDIRARGSRRVLKVNVDLEDSHFMTPREISKNNGFVTTKLSKLGEVSDGIPVSAIVEKNDINIVLKKPIHTLVIGATRTGKSAGFISPSIEILARTKTKPSLVVTDPKGELFTQHAATLEKNGYNVHVIDLMDVYHSTKWNPFNDVWRKTDEIKNGKVVQKAGKYYYDDMVYLTNESAEKAREERNIRLNDEIYVDLQDLMYTICPVENKKDSTWQRGARDLLFALALAFWEDVRDGYMPREKFNLYNLYRNVTDYAKGDCEELNAYFATRAETSQTRGLSNTVLVSEKETLSSYLGDVNQYLSWMADGGIAALTSGNDIEFDKFDEEPNALFLIIPDDKETRYKLVTLCITQMYKALVEKATKNRTLGKMEGQRLLRNTYFLMDEFGNLPMLHNIDSIVTVGAGRGIYLVPVVQDYSQIDNKYGKEKANIMRNNCNVQIFIGTNDEGTRRAISDLCGKKKVKQISYSENKDMSVTTAAQSVPLIYPSELEHFNDPDNGIIGNVIVVSLGNYPIKSRFTPVFKAKEIYKPENTKITQREFNRFNMVKSHYDIVKVTSFLNTHEHLLKEKEAKGSDAGAPSDDISPAVESGEAADAGNSGSEAIAAAELMLKQVKDKLGLLRGKIPDKTFDELCAANFFEQITIIERLADEADSEGNSFLLADLMAVKNFIRFRCFPKNNAAHVVRQQF